MSLEEFSQVEFDSVLKRWLRSLTRGKKISKYPQAILLGGQSGAGKTTVHRIKQREFKGNIIIIDGDTYRSSHPNYVALQEKYGKNSVEYTKLFAGKMVETLVNELSRQGFNLLIEGTLRTVEVPIKTASTLLSQGYQVSLAVVATNPKLSYLSTLIRYEELYALDPLKARATPKEYHDNIVENLVDNLREIQATDLFQRIQIYQRDCNCVYDSEVDRASAAEVLYDCLFGKWNSFELEMLKMEEEQLANLIKEHQNAYKI